jgi:hypothetical protein
MKNKKSNLNLQGNQTVNNMTTSLQDAVATIFKVANTRKRAFFLSGFVSALPFIIAVSLSAILVTIEPSAGQESGLDNPSPFVLLVIGIVLLLFLVAPFWFMVVGHLVRLEQLLWVKSYFEDKPLSDAESFQATKSLMMPNLKLQALIFIRYYWPFVLGLVLYFAGLTYVIMSHYQTLQPTQQPNFLLILIAIFSLPGSIIAYFVYSKFIDVKTRYLQILFVDKYSKPDFSYGQLFVDNKRLVALDGLQGRSFGKILATLAVSDIAVNTAVGAVGGFTTGATRGATQLITQNVDAVKAAGAVAATYGMGIASVSESLVRTVIVYVLYAQATKES